MPQSGDMSARAIRWRQKIFSTNRGRYGHIMCATKRRSQSRRPLRRLLVASSRLGLAGSVIFLASVAGAAAQVPSLFAPVRIETPKPLSLPQPAEVPRQETGTSFFVDGTGYLLTARHAVAACTRILVYKEGRVMNAHLVALSNDVDLGLIKTAKTMGISAVFPRSQVPAPNDMVFAAAYDNLQGMIAHGGVMANAMVSTGSERGYIAIDSDVTFGASGAPVLDSRGLVQGIISRRVGANHILAADAEEAKRFLIAHGVTLQEDDQPQIASSASRANRAASISARVTCLQD
jgi:S1-C subfamily serine protease